MESSAGSRDDADVAVLAERERCRDNVLPRELREFRSLEFFRGMYPKSRQSCDSCSSILVPADVFSAIEPWFSRLFTGESINLHEQDKLTKICIKQQWIMNGKVRES